MSGTRTLKVEIIGDSKSAEKAFASVSNSSESFGKSIGKTALLAGAALAAVAVVGAGAALKLGQTFDSAYDTIQAGTGETGAVLEGLKDSFKDVVSSVPTDFGTAAKAITDLNSRLGLTGQPLEDLATQFINLSRITGTDLSTAIEKGTRVFGDWGIAAEDQAEALDHMFKVTQNTGIGFDQLGEAVVKFGAPLRQLGFSFEESTALIGKFEAEGVNTELVLGSMRVALGRMAKAGEEPIDTFARVTDAIKNAGDAGEANALALELFGSRAGPDMAAAIREGRFSIEDLMKTLETSETTINGTAEATDDFGERFQILKNKALVALEPIGMAALGLANIVVDTLIPAVDRLPGIFSFIGDGVKTFIGALQGDWVSSSGINPVHDALGRIGTIIHDTVIPAVLGLASFVTDTALPAIKDFAEGAAGFFANTLMPAVQGFLDGPWATFQAGLGWITDTALPAVQGFADSVAGFFNDTIAPAVQGLLDNAWAGLQTAIGWVTDTALPAISDFANQVASFFTDTILPAVLGFVDATQTRIGELVNDTLPGLTGALNAVVESIPSMDAIGTGLADAFTAVADAAIVAAPIIQDLFDAIGEAVATVIPNLISIWDQLKEQFATSTPLVASLKELFATMEPILKVVGIALGVILVAQIGLLLGALGGIVGFLNGVLPGAIQVAIGAIQILTGIIQGMTTLITGSFAIIKALIHGEWAEAWNAAKQLVSDQVEAIKLIVEGLKNVVVGLISGLVGGVVGLVQGLNDTVIGFFQNMYDQLVGNSIVPELVDAIITILGRLPVEAVKVVADFVTGALDALDDLVTDAKTKAGEVVEGVVEGLAGLATDAVGKFTDFASDVGVALGGIASAAFGWGADIVQGLINGLNSKLQALRDKAAEIAGAVLDIINPFDTDSPSKLTHKWGQWIVQGLADGMGSQVRNLAYVSEQVGAALAEGIGVGMGTYQTSIGTAPSSFAPHPVGVAQGEDLVTGIGVGINANAPAAEEAAYGVGLGIGEAVVDGYGVGLNAPGGPVDTPGNVLVTPIPPQPTNIGGPSEPKTGSNVAGEESVDAPGAAPSEPVPPYGAQLGAGADNVGTMGPTVATGEVLYDSSGKAIRVVRDDPFTTDVSGANALLGRATRDQRGQRQELDRRGNPVGTTYNITVNAATSDPNEIAAAVEHAARAMPNDPAFQDGSIG